MKIKRDLYLNKLIRHKNNGLIKVITGMRRCGKSYLLFNLFHDYLTQAGVNESNIIEIALDDRENKELRNPDNILEYIKEKIVNDKIHYVIIDEVQMLDEFVDVLNSLLHIKNVDVYVTGSNSKFLSSDVVTEFRGRGDEIRIYPLNFKEFLSVYNGNIDEAWDDYYNYGGLPLILSFKTPEDKANYLSSLFKKVYISDIVERNKVRNITELDELVSVLASSIGSLTNPLKLSNTFKSVKNKKISSSTIDNYINYLQDAFLISKARKYDVKGKRYIGSPVKYYFEDTGLRNARLDFRQVEETHLMENIIYNELRIRGYKVDVGTLEYYSKNSLGKTIKQQLEVDFVATQGSQKYYVQSALRLDTPEKIAQEEKSLNLIDDSFKKIIIVRDNIKIRRNETGLITMGLFNFLKDENSLNM